MLKWRLVLCAVLLAGVVAIAPPAQAIEKGAAELGIFGRVSFFDPAFELDDWGGVGVRAGYFLFENMALEADASLTSTDGIITEGLRSDVQVMPFHARLVWNKPVGEHTHLLLGAGYLHTEYGDDANASGDGAGALLGFRYGAGRSLTFRFEATADWYSDNDFTDESDPWDYGVQFGLGGLFGNGPGDRDKDGVTDDVDRCPDTPAGEQVDANGCTLPKDSDGDGVTDNLDKCPGTAVGTKVDANGCEQMMGETKTTLVLEGVTFATNSADLTPEARTVLDGIAVKAETNPTLRVEVAGHTDNKGSRDYNLKLSQKRAESVRDYLISKGVAGDRMAAKGYGPDQPVASNDTEEGRAQNRRIQLNKID